MVSTEPNNMGFFSRDNSRNGGNTHPLEPASTAEYDGSVTTSGGAHQQQQQHSPPKYGSTDTDADHDDNYEDEHTPDHARNSEDSGEESAPLLISAEDPAVNPLKHFKIRTLRRLSLLFLVFSAIMYFLFLVSMFFTIPKLNTHGGNYYVMMNMLIALGNLAISLQVFAIPTRSGRIINFIMIGFLFLSFILSVSVNKLRHYEGNVLAILVNLWVIFTAAWVLLCNLAVERTRVSLEEIISGRRHGTGSRAQRSCKMWVSLLWALVVFSLILAMVVLITLSLAVDSYDSRISPPGEYVEVEDNLYRIHIYCNRPQRNVNETTPEPTILLEAGSTSAEVFAREWAEREVNDGGSTISDMRYCYWDRPGIAFSDNAPSPMSAGMAIDALSDGLNQIGERGPWILVSHGVGGIYSRIFASRHAGDLYGLVLVDTYNTEYFTDNVGRSSRGFGYWLHGLVSPLGIDKQIGWIFGGRTSEDRIFGRSQSTSGKYNLAKFQEQVAARTFTKNEILAASEILPEMTPIAVISSQQMIEDKAGWADYQRELSQLSNNLVTWEIVEAPHEVWRDDEGRRTISRAVADLRVMTGMVADVEM
ncbi:hypothetical protein BZA70DRAFT_275112 [Myxozyma melibiosi]|uniref:AB hydrolase-1 domain-containing protein n=1 Tax=Myxozyma melibiosi TaxID=54550 RepID=A0ABR1FAD1_9ASCO